MSEFWRKHWLESDQWEILKEEHNDRGIDTYIVRSTEFKDAWYIVQFGDNYQAVNISQEWGEAILKLNER